ncbi:MAG: penicillin acylase family protein [Bdellovibrionales bacterium]|nr:penicillin acylase family protein [Bdellovibrionales bacterium]
MGKFYFILVLGLTVIGHFGMGPIPPLMRRFSPFQGIWRGESQRFKTLSIRDAALRNEVQVVYDTAGIPHILAQSDEDLYWVQGYITAKDRLWQMDFQSRVADGSLSELIGEKAKAIDEYFVKLGMRQAIAAAEKELNSDTITRQPSKSYVEGVNAYINSLAEDDYPIEYFLTRTRPRLWTSRQISALLKLMAFRLSGYSDDLVLTRYLQKYGHESVENLFPEHLSLEIPFAKVRTKNILHPSGPKEKVFVTSLKTFPDSFQPIPGNGSNNWAVNGSKTKSGYTLLANDTHLSYSLPSIWYEMQLSSPGISVYGVTIPGAPGIIIGYNEKNCLGDNKRLY